MYEQQSSNGPFGRAHPVMLIGIAVFILPFMNHWSFFNWVPGWFSALGVLLILIGAMASIYNITNGV